MNFDIHFVNVDLADMIICRQRVDASGTMSLAALVHLRWAINRASKWVKDDIRQGPGETSSLMAAGSSFSLKSVHFEVFGKVQGKFGTTCMQLNF